MQKFSHISHARISKCKRCFNVKYSTYDFHMKTRILADFQICTSVPLSYLWRKVYLGVIQKVRSLRRGGGGGGGGHWKANKNEQGEGGPSMCVRSLFKKKNAEIFKMKFNNYSPVFPIDYNGSMKY